VKYTTSHGLNSCLLQHKFYDLGQPLINQPVIVAIVWLYVGHTAFRGYLITENFAALGTIAKLSPSPTNSYGVESHRTDVNAYPMVLFPQLQAFFQKIIINVAIGLVLI
jgi:hypothetical protein